MLKNKYHPKSRIKNGLTLRALQVGACIFLSMWLLAVAKVFFLENEKRSILPSANSAKSQQHHIIQSSMKDHFQRIEHINEDKTKRKLELNVAFRLQGKSSSNYEHLIVYTSDKENKKSYRKNQKEKIIPAHELKWPPIQPDGTVPITEGTEIMYLTNLAVPRFWEYSPSVVPEEHESKVNGQETIFLMIASYRDFQCRETIASAFERADHPERLFVGAVDQVVDGDTGCLDLEVPCSKDPSQLICKHLDQISVYKVDARIATGPVTARHIGDRMYRGQHFLMQMDAHCQFVRHWDTKIIHQWASTGNEMCVLTSYLTDLQGSIDEQGDSTRETRPIMCNSDFEGDLPARYLRHGSQPETYPTVRNMPQLEPFWAAGFSFSRGHFTVRVPYDALMPMVFMGEEISIGIRGFTFGYDYYAPKESVVFHEYADYSSRRKKIPMFWDNMAEHQGEGQKSLKRSMAIISMAPDIDPADWDHTDEKKYGIGNVRSVELFYKLFKIDTSERRAVPLCPFVHTGIMHRTFQKYLRDDGLGIDYSKLEDFDIFRVF